MNDKIEEIRQRHIKKFRRFQWVSGIEGVAFAIALLIWHHPAWGVGASALGIICLAEEYLIEKVKAMPAHTLMELDRLYKKFGV